MKLLVGAATTGMAIVLVAGCFPSQQGPNTRGNQRGGAGGSIVAAIGGIEQGDDQREEIKYQLICKDDVKVVGKLKDDKFVEFTDAKLKDGLQCAMEVSAKIDPMISSWYGVDKAGNPIPGLYYSSSFGVIQSSKLSLTLYKLYSTPPADPFWAELIVNFPAEATIAANLKLSANLVCASGQLVAGVPQDVAGAAAQRKFTFKDLSVAKLKTTTCTKLVVLVDKNPAFESELAAGAISFATAELRKTVTLSPVTVKAVVLPNNPSLIVETKPAMKCLKFDDATKACLEIELPRPSNIWFAVVSGTDATNQPIRRLISGSKGIAVDTSGQVKTIAAMQAAVTTPGAFSFFAIEDLAKIQDAVLTDSLAKSLKPLETAALNGFKIQKIDEIQVHGFFEYSTEEVSKLPATRTSARWLSLVEASKPNSTDKLQIIVTGSDRFFASKRLASGLFFSFEDYLKDTGTQFYQYSYAGAVAAADLKIGGCNIAQSRFVDDLSAKYDDDLTAAGQNPDIDSCYAPFTTRTALQGWTATSKFYLFGWRKFSI
jgi:hypothetical protein